MSIESPKGNLVRAKAMQYHRPGRKATRETVFRLPTCVIVNGGILALLVLRKVHR